MSKKPSNGRLAATARRLNKENPHVAPEPELSIEQQAVVEERIKAKREHAWYTQRAWAILNDVVGEGGLAKEQRERAARVAEMLGGEPTITPGVREVYEREILAGLQNSYHELKADAEMDRALGDRSVAEYKTAQCKKLLRQIASVNAGDLKEV